MKPAQLTLILLLGNLIGLQGAEFHVRPNGLDSNPGTKEASFATLQRARDAIREFKSEQGLPPNGITVWVHSGTYQLTNTLELEPQDSGEANRPIVYRGTGTSDPVFDGNKAIRAHRWIPTPKEKHSWLHPSARGKVVESVIEEKELLGVLANPASRLTMNGRMLQLARFPNTGYAHVKTILDPGKVYMHGRTQGARPTYSMDSPAGGRFTLVEKPKGDWQAEFSRVQKATLTGYLGYDWFFEKHRIASITNHTLTLLEYSRYGLRDKEKIPRRLVVHNLLCELDRPGEWYFDDQTKTLYVWPFNGSDPQNDLGFWSGPTFANLKNCSNITLRDLTVQSVNGTLINISGGSDNLIAGCTLRNSAHSGVVINGGKDNGLVSSDLYDLRSHLTLTGGNVQKHQTARNYARNNHFTQVDTTDMYGGIRIRGMGQRFENNLVHNFLGQPITLGGNDHQIERNEVFNVGIEEGDGGAFYAGAEMWSYGNVFRHNFLHHIMCVPQAHPRGGIYPDDLNGGDTITENIFYKAAHRAVLLNGGAAHTVTHNVFVKGYYGIYNTEAWSKGIIADKLKFDSGELKRGDKNDHIWRTERMVGSEGWNNPMWKTRYPLFPKVMNQSTRRYYPIENTITNNLFCELFQNTAFRFTWQNKTLVPMETIDYITARDNNDVSMNAFVSPANLDFRFKPNQQPENFPTIPFSEIGLQIDAFRSSTPNKTIYRSAIERHWKDQNSYEPDAIYNPETVKQRIYFNTGRLLMTGATQSQR